MLSLSILKEKYIFASKTVYLIQLKLDLQLIKTGLILSSACNCMH